MRAAFSFSTQGAPTTDQGIDIQHPKLRGEWAELRFMARAAEHGLRVAKPWGDTAPYDFAVEHHGRFLRVQVKCTMYKRSLSYECDITASHVRYSSDRLDFFAVYLIEPDVWYIIPFAAIEGRTRLILSPHRPDSKYEPYREAWHLLQEKNASSRPASSEARNGATAPAEPGPAVEENPPQEAESKSDWQTLMESRFRAIKSNLALTHFKPRR